MRAAGGRGAILALAALAALAAVGAASGGLGDVSLAMARLGGGASGLSGNGTSAWRAPAWTALWERPSGTPKPKEQRLAELREENAWKNNLVLWILPQSARDAMPMPLQVDRGGVVTGANGW